MWIYAQATGKFRHDDGTLIMIGYSGAGVGKNNPYVQETPNVGPIPRGIYYIGTPEDTLTHGPFVLPLTPHPANDMFGRSAFLIHGDSKEHPGTASQGCIILPRDVREKINRSVDRRLVVVAS